MRNTIYKNIYNISYTRYIYVFRDNKFKTDIPKTQ